MGRVYNSTPGPFNTDCNREAGRTLLRLLRHQYVLWAVLALPSLPMLWAMLQGMTDGDGRKAVDFLLHPTGEFAARFMIVAMIATPLRMMFPRGAIPRWLIRHRRHFGFAAVLYAALHTAFYIAHVGGIQPILGEFWKTGIWTGWFAMLVLVPLGLTSNDASVRTLGTHWKTLQRGVYFAAVATLVHWIFVNNNFGPAILHFLPLAFLEAYRMRIHIPNGARSM